MTANPPTEALSEPVFATIRGFLAIIVILIVGMIIRQVIISFSGKRSKELGRRRAYFAVAVLTALAFLVSFRAPAEEVLKEIGGVLEPALLIPEQGWLGAFLVGLYYSVIVMLGFVLVSIGLGSLFWFIDSRLVAWQERAVANVKTTGVHSVVYLQNFLRKLNRFFRLILFSVLVLWVYWEGFKFFPRTAAAIMSIKPYLGTPIQEIGSAILDYLPKLRYLAIILFLGWIFLRLVKHIFNAIADGSLVIRGFNREWAIPTYRLLRSMFLLFLLMVSFPYFPGAGSEFFKGFSLFVGALVTFGSAGAIGNIVAGTLLTYTGAFRVGDMIKINDVYGLAIEKSLLVTRVRTNQNEEVSIPNSTVLSSAIVNFTNQALREGLVLTVKAGIGYDVDWRTVHKLMIQSAQKTENILNEPAPMVLQTNLGDYAVNYELRAWTKNPKAMRLTESMLRSNVLDAFNRAGVEIMTPSVIAHREADEAVIPKSPHNSAPELS